MLYGNDISSEVIEERKETLTADEKIFQNNESFFNDTKFDAEFSFGGNKISTKEDFLFFHSAVEGKCLIYFQINSVVSC